MTRSIPEGAILTASPPWRQSLGEVPGRQVRARLGRALPASVRAARSRRSAARRPRAALVVTPAPPRPAGPACKNGGPGLPPGPPRLADPLRGATVRWHADSDLRGASREAAGVAGQQRFFGMQGVAF